MPYKLVKVVGGYKVGLVSGGKMTNGKKYLSDKPLTKIQAQKQITAININEKKKKKKIKS